MPAKNNAKNKFLLIFTAINDLKKPIDSIRKPITIAKSLKL